MPLPSEELRELMLNNAPLGSSTPYEFCKAFEPLSARGGAKRLHMCGLEMMTPLSDGSRAAL
jgi:hypothetical protein